MKAPKLGMLYPSKMNNRSMGHELIGKLQSHYTNIIGFHVHVYIYPCMQTLMHVRVNISIYTYVYIHKHIHTLMQIWIHACMHTYIHTHTCPIQIYSNTVIFVCLQTYINTLHTHMISVFQDYCISGICTFLQMGYMEICTFQKKKRNPEN